MNMTLATIFSRACFLCSLFCLVEIAHANENVDVDASIIVGEKRDISIRYTFKNVGNSEIEILRSDLPWDPLAAVLVVYYGRGGLGQTLLRGNPIHDTGYEEIKIAAHGEISGDIDLNLYFSQLKKVKDLSDVIVFWSYDAKIQGDSEVRKFGGKLLVPLH
jgi:hypothetical protein